MKKLSLILSLLVCSFAGLTQTIVNDPSSSTIYGFREFMVKTTSSAVTRNLLEEFKANGGDKRFFTDGWVPGSATNNYDVTLSEGYTFNYDFLENNLYARWKDSSIVVNNNYLKYFSLVDTRGFYHYFIKFPTDDLSRPPFYEVLSYEYDSLQKPDAGYKFVKSRTIKVVKANKNDYLANQTGNYSDKIKSIYEYFIGFPDGKLVPAKFNKKFLADTFAGNDKAQELISKMTKVNEDTIVSLVRSLNKG